ncbi:MAG: DegT/DnrJ/EryC1/StrS family aminotransferase [Reichenbachiella sp.]
MKVPFVDLKIQYDSIKSHIDSAVAQVHQVSQYIGGKKVEQFEMDIEQYLNVKHCVTTGNGTDALEIAMSSLGIGRGDEVIVPATSWVSTASSVHAVGARPVFVDILPDSYTIDPIAIEEAITEQTCAIVPVHIYGQMADMNAVSEIARKHDILIIEDAAQAIGSMQDGQHIGAKSDIAVLSFYPGKNLGAYGDGGAIITNEEVFAKTCRVLGNLGQKEQHNHVALGRNSRLDTIQASVLSVKIKALNKWNQRRNSIAKLYDQLLSDLPIQLPYISPSNYSNFHLYVIEVPNRNQVLKRMMDLGVSCQVHYPKALPDLHPFKGATTTGFPIAKLHADKCLSLPMFPELTKEQIEYVAEALHKSI